MQKQLLFPFMKGKESPDLFQQVIDEMVETRRRKNSDYGNAFAEFYDEFGNMGILCDLGRKFLRFKTFAQNKDLKVSDETIEDTLKDLAVIATNAVVWMRMRKNADKPKV